MLLFSGLDTKVEYIKVEYIKVESVKAENK